MSNNNPEEIRRDIERTRAELSENVNALGNQSNPSNIARSQVDKVKDGARDLKERVFGSADDPYDSGKAGELSDRAGEAVDEAKFAAQQAADDAKLAAQQAPYKVKQRTRGNPLAAGLIAAGVGALIGGLLPATRTEQEAAEKVKDAAQPAVDEAKKLVTEAKENLQPVAEDAAQTLKETAQGAADHVKQDATQAKDEVTQEAKSAQENVKQGAKGAAEKTKQDVQQAPDQH